jgi:ABC-type methionine transport system permease subunit
VRSANHQANSFAVANGLVDVATSNSVNTVFLNRQNPAIANQIQVIWQSPPIPESGILLRSDLPADLKAKIREFFVTYGQGAGPEAERQRAVLTQLNYSQFRPDVADGADRHLGHGPGGDHRHPLRPALLAQHRPAVDQQPVRRLMDLLRSIPDLVLGTLFLVAVGLGPFAGVMALMLNTGGVLAKLFSEAVESIDKGPVEGVRATGAVPLQEIVWGVLPQVAPLWTSYALYRFESNSRSATVLGLIGAGGIGQLLFDSLNGFNYSQVAAIALVIVVAVSMIDILSQAIRSRLL